MDELLVTQGEAIRHVYFVQQGSLLQSHIDEEREPTVKRFFPNNPSLHRPLHY